MTVCRSSWTDGNPWRPIRCNLPLMILIVALIPCHEKAPYRPRNRTTETAKRKSLTAPLACLCPCFVFPVLLFLYLAPFRL
ncbi:hypothetical protein ARMGADRAFT_85082 [Armillaria gallica]|uniref:Uncharacterized protein n=1 Tax=Armillaria gallica TaxID=47427 RepID=A0A2H3CAT3_ARMGA|nr:hypothetical protein ARMGADRAFT_85082 [Armillaria gallica]